MDLSSYLGCLVCLCICIAPGCRRRSLCFWLPCLLCFLLWVPLLWACCLPSLRGIAFENLLVWILEVASSLESEGACRIHCHELWQLCRQHPWLVRSTQRQAFTNSDPFQAPLWTAIFSSWYHPACSSVGALFPSLQIQPLFQATWHSRIYEDLMLQQLLVDRFDIGWLLSRVFVYCFAAEQHLEVLSEYWLVEQ